MRITLCCFTSSTGLTLFVVVSGFYRWLYERFGLPVAPIYGGFPVKFRTFLGDPIPYDPNINATELAEKVCASFTVWLSFFFVLTPKVVTNLVFALQVQQAVQALINQHQQIPGNILRALLERFHTTHKDQ